MKSKRTCIFRFSVGVLLAELFPFFDGDITTDGGYIVCVIPHTVSYRSN